METADSSVASTGSSAGSMLNLFLNEINRQDINELLNVQHSLLERLDKTTEKLDGINRVSAKRYSDATKEFSNHTQMLTTVKTDLDLIFTRIKVLKTRLNKKYPDAYANAVQMHSNSIDSLDDDDDDTPSTTMKPSSHPTLVKSQTVDYSQLASIRETYSLAQIHSATPEPSSATFDAVRRFVFEKSSSGGQDLTTLFKNARDELKKINEGFLGGTHPKSTED